MAKMELDEVSCSSIGEATQTQPTPVRDRRERILPHAPHHPLQEMQGKPSSVGHLIPCHQDCPKEIACKGAVDLGACPSPNQEANSP